MSDSKATNYEYALDLLARGADLLLTICDDTTETAGHPACGSAAFTVSAMFTESLPTNRELTTDLHEISDEDADKLAPHPHVHDQRTLYLQLLDGTRKKRMGIEIRPPSTTSVTHLRTAHLVWPEHEVSLNSIEVTDAQAAELLAAGAKEVG